MNYDRRKGPPSVLTKNEKQSADWLIELANRDLGLSRDDFLESVKKLRLITLSMLWSDTGLAGRILGNKPDLQKCKFHDGYESKTVMVMVMVMDLYTAHIT